MSLKPMIIGAEQLETLRKLKKFAEDNPFSFDDLLDIKNGQAKAAGDQKDFVCVIPVDYRVVFSIEYQPAGPTRHLSISVPATKKMPNPAAVDMIMKRLGFNNPLDSEHTLVRFSEEENAINVIEFI